MASGAHSLKRRAEQCGLLQELRVVIYPVVCGGRGTAWKGLTWGQGCPSLEMAVRRSE